MIQMKAVFAVFSHMMLTKIMYRLYILYYYSSATIYIADQTIVSMYIFVNNVRCAQYINIYIDLVCFSPHHLIFDASTYTFTVHIILNS